MPAWLISVIIQAALPTIIQWLLDHGHPASAAELTDKKGKEVVKEVKAARYETDEPPTNVKT